MTLFTADQDSLDIKDDNIMITIESDAVLTDFVKFQKENLQHRHVQSENGRVTYLSQGDFGPLRGSRLLPELADFNLSFPGLDSDHGHISAIQSHRFRAPEVLLGCPWSYSADIWNLGLLVSRCPWTHFMLCHLKRHTDIFLDVESPGRRHPV